MIAYIKGETIQIDECDLDLLEGRSWYRNSWGQFERTSWLPEHRYTKTLHRVIMERKLNRRLKRSQWVEFVNEDKRDYRRENLQLANRHKPRPFDPKRNKVGFKGVTFYRRRYRAQLTRTLASGFQVVMWLGAYDTPEEAHAAYNEAVEKYYGADYVG